MYLFSIEVKPSKIEGKGVFSLQPIPKGSIVWKYVPGHDKSISVEKYNNLNDSQKKQINRVAYLSELSGNYIYPPENDLALYTNHDPVNHNLSAIVNTDISPEPYFIANRDITIGEEITNNYNEFDLAIASMKKKPTWL